MEWTSTYKSRVVAPGEAVKAINSRDRIFLTGNVSVPQKTLAALVDHAPQLENVEICQALTVGSADYVSPEMEGHLRINSIFISANIRKAVHEGRADFTPVLLSEFPLLFKRGLLPLDVAMIHVSPPDEHGFCSLGVEVGLTKTAFYANMCLCIWNRGRQAQDRRIRLVPGHTATPKRRQHEQPGKTFGHSRRATSRPCSAWTGCTT